LGSKTQQLFQIVPYSSNNFAACLPGKGKTLTLNLENLNDDVRTFMLAEVEQDEASGSLYMSKRFNAHGHEVYPALLKEAIQRHDDAWLANELLKANAFKAVEHGSAWGKPSMGRVDRTAHETLAEGQFNTFYMRGLCRYAVAHGITTLEFYRAGEVFQERPESHARVGQQFSPETILRDLAAPFGTRTETGLPPEPNSTLSLRIPRDS
jgi:hypothetical protein